MTVICGMDFTLQPHPCTKGGPDHTPVPEGMGARFEYGAQLLCTGWIQHRCPACLLWVIWLPLEPNVQPPALPAPDGDEWELPEDVDDLVCLDCAPNDEEELDDRPGYRHTDTLQPLAEYL